jgi:hypothetical protein
MAEELTARTTSLLHRWELTIQQTLRLGGSGQLTTFEVNQHMP